MRRAWIEILESYFVRIVGTGSPSVRRAWIEIPTEKKQILHSGSPSVRRAWIEIETARLNQRRNEVALREEGVD